MSVRPRSLVFRGRVEAVGVMIALAHVQEATARRLVLTSWGTGARLYEHDAVWLMLFGSPRSWHVERMLGAPLVDVGGVIASCPLTASERRPFGDGAIVVVRGGQAHAIALANARELDPASWLHLGDLCVVRAAPLVAPPAPPKLADEPAIDDKAPGLIERLGGVAPERDDLRRALTEAAARRAGASSGTDVLPAQPSRLRQWFQRALFGSGWGRLIGRQHARYLKRMAELFERGDLDQALRHAIPAAELEQAQQSLPSLGWLSPRHRLELTRGPAGAASAVHVDSDSHAYMRGLYEQAFQQLVRDERYEDAAYVLLELLRDDTRGVTFLEEHGRARLAAEIAEARGLGPGLVVRLWFRAGEPARAVRFARRTGAFADAVMRLARVDAGAAARLRLVWADHAASTGDYVTAVEAAWPVESARRLTEAWIDRGIEAGGPAGARLLIKKLRLAPEAQDVVTRGRDVLEDASFARLPERVELTRALADEPASDAVGTLSRYAARALVRDSARFADPSPGEALAALRRRALDPLTRADLPAVQRVRGSALAERAELDPIRIAASDAGAVPVWDAALLPDGRVLVALGESGIQLLSARGGLVAHFDCPAHELVIADSGLRALALARRDAPVTIARLDLERRTVRPWCEQRLHTWARSYDGSSWLVSYGGGIDALDVCSDAVQSLWRVSEPNQSVLALARAPNAVSVWMQGRDEAQVWTYSLPELRMLRRPTVDTSDGTSIIEAVLLAPDGDACVSWLDPEEPPRAYLSLYRMHQWRLSHVARLPSADSLLALDGDWLVTASAVAERRIVVQLVDTGHGRPRAAIAFEGASRAGARLDARWCAAFDDRGRVVVLATATGERVRDLRISLR